MARAFVDLWLQHFLSIQKSDRFQESLARIDSHERSVWTDPGVRVTSCKKFLTIRIFSFLLKYIFRNLVDARPDRSGSILDQFFKDRSIIGPGVNPRIFWFPDFHRLAILICLLPLGLALPYDVQSSMVCRVWTNSRGAHCTIIKRRIGICNMP